MKKGGYSRLLALILCAALILPLTMPLETHAATSGSFGAGLHWQLKNGRLTISGSGAIPNYTDDSKVSAPWYSVRYSVTEIVIKDGITRIGDFSLFDMANVTYVSLPDSLISIGDQGMAYMRRLTALDIPSSVRTLGPACFGNCDMLRHLYVDGYDTEFVWKSYGFRYESEVDDYVKIPGVMLYGYFGSTAESYAEQYDNITFSPLDISGISGTVEKTEEEEQKDIYGAIHIDTVEELMNVANEPYEHYVLDCDLTLPSDWVSIFFHGSLDGQGYTIRGLDQTSSELGRYGLFALISGSVSNLTVEGSINASGNDWLAAGLLASECTGEVINCSVSGSVEAETADSAFIGGMTGYGKGTFENCAVEADVSLTITAGTANQAHAGGLSGMDVRYAMDCSYEGDLLLTQRVNASNLQAEFRGIVAESAANCTVDGSMTAELLDHRYSYIAALKGAMNSVNRADISVTTADHTAAYACDRTVGCTNEGAVRIVDNSSENNVSVCGFHNSFNCRNTGEISAYSQNGGAYARAIYGSTSGNAESYFINTADITAAAPNGTATANAVYAGFEGTGSNTGAVTAEGYSAGAVGVSNVTEGSNSGEITATGRDSAYAKGLSTVSAAVNSAPVTAYAIGYPVSAAGIDYAGIGGGSNSAPIRAVSVNGSAYAVAVEGTDYFETPGGRGYTNTGTVTACGGGTAGAHGIYDCSYSKNLADVTAEHTGAEASGDTSAYGIQNGVGNENRANITAQGAPGLNLAAGCFSAIDSISAGSITAAGGAAHAYALWSCENSISSGSVTASSNAGDASGTQAYGHYSSTNCSSSASASARSSYFSYDEETWSVGLTRCEAGNAGSASVRVGGYSASDPGEYYVWVSSKNGALLGFSDQAPSQEDEVYGTLAAIITMENADVSWTPPTPPEPDPEPDPEPSAVPEPFLAGFYYSNEDDGSRIRIMTNHLGNFSFYNGKEPDISDPDTTDYRTVYLCLQYLNTGDKATAEGFTALTLPTGFSFRQDIYEQSMRIPVPAMESGDFEEVWVPVYPLFSMNYRNNERLQCSFIGSTGYSRQLSLGCQVRMPFTSQEMARINYFFDAKTNRYSYVDYWWEDGIFEQDNTMFHQNINELSALLSAVIYHTNDAPSEALISLKDLGFSCVKMGGANSVEDCVHLVAKKTLITEETKVQELEVLIILGTSSTDGWIGNATFLETEREHRTFLSSAESGVKTLSDHVNTYAGNGQERLFLITGHSRGAATANLAADLVNEQYEEDWENIYAYTYAAPRTTRRERVESVAYRNTNIFNIVNINDLVGYVPGCYDNHGMTLFYEDEVDPVVSLYIMPMWLGTKVQPFREDALKTLTNPFFYISLEGIKMGAVNARKIEKYHLMPFYLEDIWHIMPEQIYTHDAGIMKMKSYYQQIISDLAHTVGGNTVYLAEYLVQLAGMIGEPIRSAVLKSVVNTVCMPLNLVDFFEQPVMDAPLEISCPVDLKIYDGNGQLLGEVKDDEIISGSEHFILSVVGDKKSLLLRENMDYMIEITGYDTGTMDLQLMQLDGDGNPEAIVYRNVPVSPNKTFTAWVQNGVLSLFDVEQIVQPERLTGSDLKTVEIRIETDNEAVTTVGAGSYIAGQQVLLTAVSSDEDAVFVGWYEGDTLVANASVACIVPDHSMTLTPKYLNDISENCILQISRGSNSISATVACREAAVLHAAAYSESGQMLWTGSVPATTGVLSIPVPATVLQKADTVKVFLLDSRTLQPLCHCGD